MTIETLTAWLQASAQNLMIAMSVAALLAFLIARYFVARGLIYITTRTRNQWDDIIVKHLRPYRLSLLAPIFVTYYFARLWPENANSIRTITLFLIVWLVILTLNSLLNAFNL